MKKIFVLFVIIASVSACKTPGKTVSNNTTTTVEQDGSSFEKAIVIQEKTESTGVDAEYIWLGKHYPGYKLKQQSLVYENGKPYDVMDIVIADGEEKTIYFDISNYFGKW